VIRSIDPTFWTTDGAAEYLEVVDGSALIENDNEALLGRSLAETCGVRAGDRIRVLTVKQRTSGSNLPYTAAFTVKGIVSSGYNELDALWCLVNRAAGERLLSPGLSQNYVTVKIDDPYRDADAVARRIQWESPFPCRAYTWKELSGAQYEAYESTRQMLMLIMALIVLVAAVNVSSATSMLVISKQSDVAMLKALGVPSPMTRRIFTACGLVTGLAGAAAGTACGLLLGAYINQALHGLETIISFFSHLTGGGDVKILDPGFYLETIPIIINWKAVGIIALGTILAATAAASFPARRAAKERPLELLRKV
jgi:lipoprotein-releasing system permease protein